MSDPKKISRLTRSFGFACSLMIVVAGGLILIVGHKSLDNPYLSIEWAAILIGCLGNSAIFLNESLRKPAVEAK